MLLAHESIRLCAAYLRRCFDDGADETARAAGRTSAQRRSATIGEGDAVWSFVLR
jgi:alcohol dehydrogenase class IV